jgi:hypothetical protein
LSYTLKVVLIKNIKINIKLDILKKILNSIVINNLFVSDFMKFLSCFIIFITLLAGCSQKKPSDLDLKSPCVGAKNSPCDLRINPNFSSLPQVG